MSFHRCASRTRSLCIAGESRPLSPLRAEVQLHGRGFRYSRLPGRSMAVLQVLTGMTPGQVFALSGERMILGRHPECDIVLDVGAVSRQHAVVVRMNNEFYVEDLKSRNGTFVNGEVVHGRRQAAGERSRQSLRHRASRFTSARRGADALAAHDTAHDDTLAGRVHRRYRATSRRRTIMSSFDVQSNRSGFQISVNPEVKLQAAAGDHAQSGDRDRPEHGARQRCSTACSRFSFRPIAASSCLQRSGDRRAGAEGGEVSPRRRRRIDSHQPDDRQSGDDVEGSDSLGRRRRRHAVRRQPEHRRLPHSLDDVRPADRHAGKALGVIQIDTLDQRSRFQTGDLDVLAGVAFQAAFAIENAQLHDAALKKQAFERDLDLAHKVQQGFLARRSAADRRLRVLRFLRSGQPDRRRLLRLHSAARRARSAVVLGDVAGKGMPAALLMAKLSADVRYSLATGDVAVGRDQSAERRALAAAIGKIAVRHVRGRRARSPHSTR